MAFELAINNGYVEHVNINGNESDGSATYIKITPEIAKEMISRDYHTALAVSHTPKFVACLVDGEPDDGWIDVLGIIVNRI